MEIFQTGERPRRILCFNCLSAEPGLEFMEPPKLCEICGDSMTPFTILHESLMIPDPYCDKCVRDMDPETVGQTVEAMTRILESTSD